MSREAAPGDAGESLRIRRLQPQDIPALSALEARAFEESWPPTAFARELSENQLAHYIVAELTAASSEPVLVGFAGLWTVVDQAHVVAIGVEPSLRRRGIGRLLLTALLAMARELGMTDATLECRASNEGARLLYRSLGFHEVGRRKRYYEGSEDALIMTTESFDAPAFLSASRSARKLADRTWPGALDDFEGAGLEGGCDL